DLRRGIVERTNTLVIPHRRGGLHGKTEVGELDAIVEYQQVAWFDIAMAHSHAPAIDLMLSRVEEVERCGGLPQEEACVLARKCMAHLVLGHGQQVAERAFGQLHRDDQEAVIGPHLVGSYQVRMSKLAN